MRPALSRLLGKKNLVGVEIGVYTGRHAKEILGESNITIEKLYLVDPYTVFMQNGEEFPLATEELYQSLVKEFEPDKRVKMVRKFSVDAAKDFQDESLDFVYIDGNHEYKYVLDDIKSWLPKLKKGGLMSGHDYGNNERGVIKAVDEFIKTNKLNLVTSAPDWYFYK